MNKTEQTTSPIFYDTTPANAGPVWAWHAAPEWETQCRETSLFAHADGLSAIGKESQYANLIQARLKRQQL